MWQTAMIVIAATFCILGVVLWIAVGVVVLNPPNGSKSKSYKVFLALSDKIEPE